MKIPIIDLNCKTHKHKDINILLVVIETILLQETKLLTLMESLDEEVEKIPEGPIKNFVNKQKSTTLWHGMVR